MLSVSLRDNKIYHISGKMVVLYNIQTISMRIVRSVTSTWIHKNRSGSPGITKLRCSGHLHAPEVGTPASSPTGHRATGCLFSGDRAPTPNLVLFLWAGWVGVLLRHSPNGRVGVHFVFLLGPGGWASRFCRRKPGGRGWAPGHARPCRRSCGLHGTCAFISSYMRQIQDMSVTTRS